MKTEEELIWENYQNSIINEQSGGIDYGCLMIYFDEQTQQNIVKYCEETFNPEILAEFGIEDEPHITCQYGFKDDITIQDITDFINQNVKKPLDINLGQISRFDCEDYDVIKIDVDSPDLHKLSKKIRKHFESSLQIDYPDYHPHVTLAYVKKGSIPHIDGDNMFNGKNYVFDDFIYSDKNNEKFDIKKFNNK